MGSDLRWFHLEPAGWIGRWACLCKHTIAGGKKSLPCSSPDFCYRHFGLMVLDCIAGCVDVGKIDGRKMQRATGAFAGHLHYNPLLKLSTHRRMRQLLPPSMKNVIFSLMKVI